MDTPARNGVEGTAASSLRAVVELARSRAPIGAGTRIVAVDGPSGSGKTTFAELLAAQLGGAPVLHMDDLYPGWDGLADSVPILAGQVLEPLSRGQDGSHRRWDWLTGDFAQTVPVPVSSWLVVEGVGSGSRPCAAHLAALVWLTANRQLRRERGLARDGAAYEPHWHRWALQEERLFAAEQTCARADIHVDTSTLPAPE